MTVIRPNSVSGINSITAQADEIKVFKSNGTQGGLIIGGANLNATSGISTILALNVTGNVSIAGTLTYQDVTNVDSLGIGTFRTGINVSGGTGNLARMKHLHFNDQILNFLHKKKYEMPVRFKMRKGLDYQYEVLINSNLSSCGYIIIWESALECCFS